MVATSCFNKHSRVCLSIGLYLFFIFIAADTRAQTATYHLHRETSSTANLFQLKTGAPDAAILAEQTTNLKNKAVGEYLIRAYDTQSGVPGASGTITAGSTVTFSLWLKRTGTGGTLFPRAKLNLNSAAGTSIAVVTGTTALTTTLTKYTLSGTVPANVSITASDRIYLWVGINLTAAPNTNSVGELDIEGALNGNYDSTVTVPLPSPPPAPSISSLTPSSGPVGTSVTVAGTNFGATQGTSTITFNGTIATPASWSATSISVPVPAGATTGPVVVTVNGQASNGASFTVTPKINNLSPTSGDIGAAVTITGTTFGATQGTSTITFNGTTATPASWSATSITVPVPSGATTGPVVVTVNGQASNSVTFTVTMATGTIAGTITKTSDGAPINGALVEALQTSVVKGSSTSAANGSYSIAGLAAGTYDVRTVATGYQTRIQNGVVVTANNTTTVNQSLDVLPTSGDIEYVYDELGRLVAVMTSTEIARYTYDAVGNLLSISRGTTSQVSVIEFTPNNGPIGTTVTIYGTAFSTTASQNTVTFNGVAATVTSATATRIVTSVPAGATTGPISVTSPAGTATSSTSFVVGTPGAPTITGFTPTIGVAGTSVTITGTNFEPSSYSTKIKFNKTFAGLTSATPTEIVTSVPSLASSGRITVETPVGLAVSSADFFIPPAPRTAADVGMTGRMAIGENKVVSIPAAGKIAIIVFDGAAGQWVSIGTSNSTISAVNCCTTSKVSIYKPDGTTLLTPTDFYQAGGGTPSVQLPVTGTYAIVVEPFSNLVGSVTLWLSEDLSPPLSINGPAVTLTNQVGQNARLLFSGTAGQWVSVGVSNTTIGAVSCCTTSKVSILKPDGTALLAPFDFYSVGTGTPSVQLPANGTYAVFVDPVNGLAGNATITLSEDLSPPISINGPAVTLTNRAGQNARLSFSGNAGQWISLGVSDTTIGAPQCCTTSKVAIYKPDGTVLIAPTDFYSPIGTASVQLATSGNYTIVVDPYLAVAGNVTLTLSEDLSPPISINGGPVTLTNRAGQNARLSFTGNAGQWISLVVSDVTIAATTCCTSTTVAIYKPDGTALLAPLTVPAAGLTTQSVQLPVNGSYTIVLDPYNAVAGNATLTLWEDLSPPISINGPPVVLQFTHVGQNSRLLFSGNAGQWVSVGTSDSTISAVNCCSSSKVSIYKPDGTVLLAPTDFYQVGGGTPSVQLPVTGTYAMVVEPFNDLLGSVTLWLSEDLSPPISLNGPAVTLTNRVGQNARLFFSGSTGQWVSVGVSDTNIAAVNCCTTSKVSILKPDGTVLLAPFDFYSVGAGTPSVQLPASGTYAVFVDPLNGMAGNATITLSEDLSPPISINGPAVTLTNRIGQNARLLFSGSAGQWVSVGVSDTTIGAVNCCTTSKVSILKPDGTALLAPLDFYSVGAGTPSVQLPTSGTYAIVVDPYLAVAGNSTITLSEDLSPPISINGPAVTLTNRAGQNARLSFSGTAGQWVSLGVTDVTIGAPQCCTTSKVAIYKPDGTVLIAPTDFYSPIGTASVQLPTSGNYTIVVDPYLAVAGNATLTLSEDLSPPISINGGGVTLTNRAGQNARLSFSGNAGQWISLVVSDVTIAATACCTSTTVAIYKPDGTVLLAPLAVPAAGLTTQSVQLPVSGSYTIVLDPYNAVAGNATLTLWEDLSPPISINGPSVVLQFTHVGQNSRLLFSGNAGQWVSVGTSDSTISAVNCCSSSRVSIYKPDGTVLLSPYDFYQVGGGTPSVQLPVTGTYAIVVEPFNDLLGSVTLWLSEDLSPPISLNGPAVTLTNRVGQNARLFFSGSTGQWVSVGVSDTNIAAVNCCTTSKVSILKPDGTALLAPFDFYQVGAGTPSVQLPVSGTYAVFVDPLNGMAGNATITLSEDLSPPISINGPAVTLTNRIGQNARLLFSGSAGQWVSVGVSDTTIGAVNCCTTSKVAIYKPDGTALLSPLDFYSVGAGTPSVQLPSSGTYAIFVDPINAAAGNTTITLSEDLSPPISINGPSVTLTNRAGQNARLPFSGSAGQWVSVAVSNTTIGAVNCCTTSKVSILKPDGTALLAPLDFYQAGLGTQSVQLPTSGNYAIVVDPYLAVAGDATITLLEDLSPPITVGGAAVFVDFARAGQNASLDFAGTAGQQLIVRITGNTVGNVAVRLLKPDGTQLTSATSSSNSFSLASQTLPVTGTYFVTLDPSTLAPGGLNVILENPAANLALNKTATQSSTNFSAPASRAVDGNTDGNFSNGSVTHTQVESQAWWHVDLGSVQSIGRIDVFNRTDCCGSALTNFYVFVSDVPFTSTDVTATQNQAGVFTYNNTGQAGSPTSININRTGRYIRVQLAGTERLSLAEVQVWP